jgi:hypothetical protein
MLQITHRLRESLGFVYTITLPHAIADVYSWEQSYGGFGHLRRLDENTGMLASILLQCR